MKVLFNALSAYVVWCGLVLGAAAHMLEVALVVALGAIAIQLGLAPAPRAEFVRVVALTLLGTAVDTVLIRLGTYTPVGYGGFFCPIWISLLWANFATTVPVSLHWLQGRPYLAAGLGAVAGPLSYAAASRLGAAEVHEPAFPRYALLAAVWAATMFGIFRLRLSATTLKKFSVGAFLVMVFASQAAATGTVREVGGVPFVEEVEAHGVRMRLHGAGVLWYRVVFRGYVAALYLPDGAEPNRVLDDIPKRLEIHYFWSIPAQAFGEVANKVLRQNLSSQEFAAIAARVEELHRVYENVRPGDRYALTYVPGIGTELSLNGVVKARVPGADFAAAYFSIWLGDQPLDAALKRALLRF